MTWDKVDASFLDWIRKKDGMEADTVWNAMRELKRRDEEKKAAKEASIKPQRDAYVSACKEVVKVAKDVEELEAWFRVEADHRLQYGIIKGEPAYLEIVQACVARKAEFKPQPSAA